MNAGFSPCWTFLANLVQNEHFFCKLYGPAVVWASTLALALEAALANSALSALPEPAALQAEPEQLALRAPLEPPAMHPSLASASIPSRGNHPNRTSPSS